MEMGITERDTDEELWSMESKTARDTERVPLRKPINLIQETFYTHNPMSSFYSPVYWLKNHKCVHISKLYWKNQCSVHA